MAIKKKQQKPTKPTKPTGIPQQKPRGRYMTKKPVATWAINSKMNRDNYPHSKAMQRKGYG